MTFWAKRENNIFIFLKISRVKHYNFLARILFPTPQTNMYPHS